MAPIVLTFLQTKAAEELPLTEEQTSNKGMSVAKRIGFQGSTACVRGHNTYR
jgi:hypothetical protein